MNAQAPSEDERWALARNDVEAFLRGVVARAGTKPVASMEADLAEALKQARIEWPAYHDMHRGGDDCICRQLMIIAKGVRREFPEHEAVVAVGEICHMFCLWMRERETNAPS